MHIGYRKSHSNVAAVICERDSSHICKKYPLIFRHLRFSMWPLSTIKVWQPHSWTLQQIRMVVPLWRRVRRRGQCETRYGVSASLSTPPLGHCSFWQRLVLFLTSQDSACARNSRAPQPLRLVSPRSDKSARTSSACIHYVAIHRKSAHAAPAATRSTSRISSRYVANPRFSCDVAVPSFRGPIGHGTGSKHRVLPLSHYFLFFKF